MLEQKQVADMAMIPSKEAKELLYILMAENYVTLQVGTQLTDRHTFSLAFSPWLDLLSRR